MDNFFEDVLQHLITLWNDSPDYDGVMCTRYAHFGSQTTMGLSWDWTQKEAAGITVLRDNVQKRHRDWVAARNDLQRALKRNAHDLDE